VSRDRKWAGYGGRRAGDVPESRVEGT
jgi:hypothetical protein